jgi:hypothetical protein
VDTGGVVVVGRKARCRRSIPSFERDLCQESRLKLYQPGPARYRRIAASKRSCVLIDSHVLMRVCLDLSELDPAISPHPRCKVMQSSQNTTVEKPPCKHRHYTIIETNCIERKRVKLRKQLYRKGYQSKMSSNSPQTHHHHDSLQPDQSVFRGWRQRSRRSVNGVWAKSVWYNVRLLPQD